MDTLKIDENPLDLAEKILKDIKSSEGMGLLKCIQCGMCTSMCPGARNSDYNPRDMIERVLEGDETIIEDENIWNCFYCYTCHSICPVGNSACEVNQILRQMAINKGIANDKVRPFTGFIDVMMDLGLGKIPSIFHDDLTRDIGEEWKEKNLHLDEIREELGLKPLSMPKESIKEIRSLLKLTKLDKRVEKINE
ncbi:CoB--CoM heterodisulfide reductase iron-sulfur subunit C [Candidatus Methanobinarius endosymbioticus]|uniref:CoB--CoM heterodisulfide reductase iron-sulfur subunit C n=1 Tax=Candidatus Methanobinarius endosymbioticus TaxID=2006182 RepID=A0A366M9Y5_9EURY|nr:CoB--CoM heterodisulfide reductase iron-sulfur subunit C [Candidatus Methanobinarius endosymbioticus]